MITRDDLELLLRLKNDIVKLESHLAELWSSMTGSRSLGNGARASSFVADRLGTDSARKEELEGMLAIRKDELNDWWSWCVQGIEDVPEPGRLILKLRYIDGLEWRQIAAVARYDRVTCIRHRNAAFDFLESRHAGGVRKS